MEELVVVNVCLLGGKDPLQNVLQVPNDIKWQDFELLVWDFRSIINIWQLFYFNLQIEQVRRYGIDVLKNRDETFQFLFNCQMEAGIDLVWVMDFEIRSNFANLDDHYDHNIFDNSMIGQWFVQIHL